ncbi:hypothetical protein CC79DRAFT_1327028 [Sarocladium strictum]
MDRNQTNPSNLMDTHERCIADILTRYRALMKLATIQALGDDYASSTPEAIAVARISMKQEFDSLYSSMKELLALSRRMKELWAFGPLGGGDPDQRAKEEKLDGDVRKAYELLCGVEKGGLEDLAKKYGGTWEAGNGEEEMAAATASSAATGGPAQGANGAVNGSAA